jgi:outer membrane biosynthesis protein TonB
MPITQIPFQDPVAPPEKPQPEQLGLYDKQGWETAYRDLNDEARVPHLLIQLQDDLARSRRREAAWISIIVHLILIISLYKIEWLEKFIPWHSVVAVKMSPNNKDVTFLELPPDLQKAPHRNSNVLSDKDRIATTRHPELDPKELRKALASPPPGRPGGPPLPQQAPPQSAPNVAQNQPPQPQPATSNPQIAQLQTPAKPNIANEFSKYGGSMSAGSAIQDAARAAAAKRGGSGGVGDNGDFGLGTGAHGRQLGNLEVLSDTQGVDFGPYLQRVLHDVKINWYSLIPESAQMKHGNLIIEFAITKDGKVAGMKLIATSGDVPLDRAAWGGIVGSNPFPPLPTEFGGEYLALRFRFFYNPTKEELE